MEQKNTAEAAAAAAAAAAEVPFLSPCVGPPPLPTLVDASVDADAAAAADAAADAADTAAAAAAADALFASYEEAPTLRFWGLDNVPGTVSLRAMVRRALGSDWWIVDRMLSLNRVVVATRTTDEPSAARLTYLSGSEVTVFPYKSEPRRTPAATRTTSDVVIVHCVTKKAPTLDSALYTLLGVSFPLHTARRVFLPRPSKKSRTVHQVYVQMASVEDAQVTCPRCAEEYALPVWDAAYDAVTKTHVHVLQLAKETFKAGRSGAVAERGDDGLWVGHNGEQNYGILDYVVMPLALPFPPFPFPVAPWVQTGTPEAFEDVFGNDAATLDAAGKEAVEDSVGHLSGVDSGSSGEDASHGSEDDRQRGQPAERDAADAAAAAGAAAGCAPARGAEAGAGAGGAAEAAGELVAQSLPAWRDCGLTTFEEGASPFVDLAATLPDAVWQDSVEDSVGRQSEGDSASSAELKRLRAWAKLQMTAEAARDAAATAAAAAAAAAKDAAEAAASAAAAVDLAAAAAAEAAAKRC